MYVKIEDFWKVAEIADEVEEVRDSGSESQYLQYNVGYWICVESVASNATDMLLRLSVATQGKFFDAIAKRLPEVGDTLILSDDRDGKRNRGARIVRIKSIKDEVNLLMTR